MYGTKESPQKIDLTYYKPKSSVAWEIKKSPVQSINLSAGLTKKQAAGRLKGLANYKLNEDTLVKAQGRMLKHPVVMSRIRNSRSVSAQPYEFFEQFLKQGDDLPDSAARAIIGKFATLVKRGRPADPEFIQKLDAVFQTGREMGMPFWEAIEEPLAICMCSIDSILHFEDRRPTKQTRTISGVELANRLSYTLWRSAPDPELVRMGRNGKTPRSRDAN